VFHGRRVDWQLWTFSLKAAANLHVDVIEFCLSFHPEGLIQSVSRFAFSKDNVTRIISTAITASCEREGFLKWRIEWKIKQFVERVVERWCWIMNVGQMGNAFQTLEPRKCILFHYFTTAACQVSPCRQAARCIFCCTHAGSLSSLVTIRTHAGDSTDYGYVIGWFYSFFLWQIYNQNFLLNCAVTFWVELKARKWQWWSRVHQMSQII
jgi:hypothetical protein